MRVKQTAKKIGSDNASDQNTPLNHTEIETSDNNSCDNQNDISDNEVEILAESRRDQDGNQYLLDGTPVIEPSAVEISNECKENKGKEINFQDFLKEITVSIPERKSTPIKVPNHGTTPKRHVPNFAPPSISVKCTACTTKYNPFTGQNLNKHPLMEVLLCSSCIQNQKEEFFVIDKDDNKETLCRWCVEGGSLICCDFCPKSYCKACIKRNLGRTLLSEILNQEDAVQWKCFICEPKSIESLKATCTKVYEDVHQFLEKKRNYKPSAKKPAPKLTEIVNKKRPFSKAFPNSHATTNPIQRVPIAKMASPPLIPVGSTKPATKCDAILHNMANYGTDWYMRNVKLRNIFTDIDEIEPRNLLNAINATKRCLEAFYSDIRNLEMEISKASSSSELPSIVSMFKSVYRHHIFNRFCQVKTRIEETKMAAQLTQSPPPSLKPKVGIPAPVIRVKRTNSLPSIVVIDKVESTATLNNSNSNVQSHCPSTAIVTATATAPEEKKAIISATNGHDVVESIDLTDESDRTDEDLPLRIVIDSEQQASSIAAINDKQPPSNEIVDLCADEESNPDNAEPSVIGF